MSRERAVSATLWSGAEVVLSQGFQFATSVALARLLAPEVFGTIAVLLLFVGLANAIVDSGFAAALIQNQEITHEDESTVFWFNMLVGGTTALLLWAFAPLIAGFFRIAALVPLTGVMALYVFLGSLGTVHRTLLGKKLEFRILMKAGAISTAGSATVAIWMASTGYGVWALAAQLLVASALNSAFLWTFHSWKPAFVFRGASLKKLFGFGFYFLASNLLETVYSRGYTIILGRFYGVRELGFFNRADGIKQMPVALLTAILGRVAFPLFAEASADKGRLRRGLKLAIQMMMLVNVPMMVGLSLVAVPLVRMLFGDAWLPSAPLVRVLALGAVLWPLHILNSNALMAQGRSDLYFRIEVMKKTAGILTLVVGAWFGVTGIAWSYVVFSLAGFGLNAFYTGRLLEYGAIAQTRDIAPIAAATIPMALAVLGCDKFINLPAGLDLPILVAIGIVVFSFSAWLLPSTGSREAAALVLGRIRSSQGATS